MRHDAADGGDPHVHRVANSRLEAYRAGFGHSIGDGDLGHVHVPHDGLHHLHGTRCSSHDSAAQRSHVEIREGVFPQNGDEHGRYAIEVSTALRRDCLQGPKGLKALAGEHHGGPCVRQASTPITMPKQW